MIGEKGSLTRRSLNNFGYYKRSQFTVGGDCNFCNKSLGVVILKGEPIVGTCKDCQIRIKAIFEETKEGCSNESYGI